MIELFVALCLRRAPSVWSHRTCRYRRALRPGSPASEAGSISWCGMTDGRTLLEGCDGGGGGVGGGGDSKTSRGGILPDIRVRYDGSHYNNVFFLCLCVLVCEGTTDSPRENKTGRTGILERPVDVLEIESPQLWKLQVKIKRRRRQCRRFSASEGDLVCTLVRLAKSSTFEMLLS